MIAMGAAYFFAVGALFSGVFDLIEYFLDKGSWIQEVHIGSVAIQSVVSLMLGFGMAIAVLHYLRWSCFREINKIKELVMFWLFGIATVGVFVAVFSLIPPIGPVLAVPLYVSFILGAGLFILGYTLQKAL
jgi:hypothetical protein